MLKSYEATYEMGRLEWIREKPDLKDGTRVIVVVDSEPSRLQQLDEIRRVLQEADGAWGRGKSLDDIDREISSTRAEDWPENGAGCLHDLRVRR